MKPFVLLAVFLGLTVSAFAQATLRVGDTMVIRLAGVPADEKVAFDAPFTVDEDGTVNIPFINKIAALGLTPAKLQASIQEKLKSEEIYTQPTVTVQTTNDVRFIYVGGAVQAPGRVPYSSDLTLMSAINAAGGFSPFANQRRINLIQDKKRATYNAKVIRDNPELDPRVYPGDQITVPQSWL